MSRWQIFLLICGLLALMTSQLHARLQIERIENTYHTYEKMVDFMNKTAAKNEDIAKLYSIGTSIQGRDLWVIELSAANSLQVGVPNVKVIGQIHGNAPVGREIILRLIEYLVDRYKVGDIEIVQLLSHTRIHLLPSLNPDGFEIAIEGFCEGVNGRHNAARVDLNRNFPGEPSRHPGDPAEEQYETSAIRRWMDNIQFVLSINVLAGDLVVSYPFDFRTTEGDDIDDKTSLGATPDDEVFRHLAKLYAANNPAMKTSCGETQYKDGIVNGANFGSETFGTMSDYNYLYHGCLELSPVVSCCRYPYAHHLHTLWVDNKYALLGLIGEAQLGVKGVVRDGATKLPIQGAQVSLNATNRATTNTTPKGEYWKLLLPGKYILRVQAEGYITKLEYFNIQGQALILDIFLDRIPPPTMAPPPTRAPPSTSPPTTPPPTASTGTNQISPQHHFQEEAIIEAVMSSSSALNAALGVCCLLLFVRSLFS